MKCSLKVALCLCFNLPKACRHYLQTNKWAESIGQALYYAKMTGLKPAVAIIMRKPTDEEYIKRIQLVNENLTIFRINAY